MAVQRLRLGSFEFDADTLDVRRIGRPVGIQYLTLRGLAIPIAAEVAAVTREDLRVRLWFSDAFIDFENSLNTADNTLRMALGGRSVPTHARSQMTLHPRPEFGHE